MQLLAISCMRYLNLVLSLKFHCLTVLSVEKLSSNSVIWTLFGSRPNGNLQQNNSVYARCTTFFMEVHIIWFGKHFNCSKQLQKPLIPHDMLKQHWLTTGLWVIIAVIINKGGVNFMYTEGCCGSPVYTV